MIDEETSDSTGAVAIIQARMGSHRLPGKVLLPLGGTTTLGWVVRAAEASESITTVVVATSIAAADDPIEAWCEGQGVNIFRGPEEDVLDRYLQAVIGYPGDPIVRLTADCPLLDPAIIDAVVELYRTSGAHYVATDLEVHLPRGTDVEAVSPAALRWAGDHAEGSDRVHVTSAIYRSRGGGFELVPYRTQYSAGHFRLTLDTIEDYRAIQAVAELLGDRPPTVAELIDLLERRPDIVSMNRGVVQKPIEEG